MPQIQKRTTLPERPIARGKKCMTEEQFQAEADYFRATIILQKMLSKGLITEVELHKIDKLNRQSFSPLLASIMPD